jgi:hypothetical protein
VATPAAKHSIIAGPLIAQLWRNELPATSVLTVGPNPK